LLGALAAVIFLHAYVGSCGQTVMLIAFAAILLEIFVRLGPAKR
jgi:hypothetical protein